jgi:hypothetical protein
MAPKGGPREGAGRKSTWNNSIIKQVKVPMALAERLMVLARHLDQGGEVELVEGAGQHPAAGVEVAALIREAMELARKDGGHLTKSGKSLLMQALALLEGNDIATDSPVERQDEASGRGVARQGRKRPGVAADSISAGEGSVEGQNGPRSPEG